MAIHAFCLHGQGAFLVGEKVLTNKIVFYYICSPKIKRGIVLTFYGALAHPDSYRGARASVFFLIALYYYYMGH
jgi:hypothetical protein